MINTAWIIADGDNATNANFFVGKGLWSRDRSRAKIFEHKKEAEDTALDLDSKAWEVTIEATDSWWREFTVVEWAK